MQRSYGIIHAVVRRNAHDPGQVLWYVRRVWLHKGSTHDRVVAHGDFRAPIGQRGAEEVVLEALRAAIDQLENGSTAT